MKRFYILILLTLLLLLGCAGPGGETTAPQEQSVPPTQVTEPAGLYEKESALETLTQGAVRVYRSLGPECYAMDMVDGDVLLFSGVEQTTITRLTGDNLYPVAQAELNCWIDPANASFQASYKGITYYDEGARSLVFLDRDLKEVRRLDVPEGIVGSPVLSTNRLKLYYCTADAVRVWDLETNLDRLLKQVAYPYQTVEGMLFSDRVVKCTFSDDGGTYTAFLSAETGELVSDLCQDFYVTGAEDRFYAVRFGGIMPEWLYGTGTEDLQMLIPSDPFANVLYLEQTHGAVTCTMEATPTTVLEYYDLTSGLRTARVELPEEFAPWVAHSGNRENQVYILGHNPDQDGPVLYLWDLEKSQVTDDRVYAGPWYTADAPDEAGLGECTRRAEEMGQRFGVQILVGPEGAAQEPWDYDLEPEYQVPVIRQSLDALEKILGVYPEGFFDAMGEDIHICLVRSIQGSAESGSLENANGVQFWDAGRAYVAMVPGDMLEMTLHHELFHLIDNYVLSSCTAYYDWEMLNPQGFAYDLDYLQNVYREPEGYLDPENRAFIDTYSMSFPKEDRARIMEYAATAGNGDYFTSITMQRKLRTLCLGIREAFHLEQYPEPLIWEQYLYESLN